MEGQGALGIHQKYFNLCSEDERRSYGSGTTWGWVINDRIFIFGWTIPLILGCLHVLSSFRQAVCRVWSSTLPELIPHLIQCLCDKKALVRSHRLLDAQPLRTLGGEPAAGLAPQTAHDRTAQTHMDGNKRVQEAACRWVFERNSHLKYLLMN